jgi:hemerythrin-like domain-containing protein
MDALKLLREDHEKVKKLLSDIESTTERAVKTRTSELARLKEEIFYPALKDHAKTREIALEAYEEHGVVDMIMAEIEQTPVEDETWMAKFTVMKENLEHHIEEEEGEMFKQARQVFDKDTLEELGERMEARKRSGLAA